MHAWTARVDEAAQPPARSELTARTARAAPASSRPLMRNDNHACGRAWLSTRADSFGRGGAAPEDVGVQRGGGGAREAMCTRNVH